MSKQSRRAARRARQRRARMKSNLIWGGLAIGALAIVAVLVWNVVRPAEGEVVEELLAQHVPEGTDPGPYSTDPPSSGKHYPSSLQAGFFDEADVEGLPPHPEGYLMHNLEHGYVILWYNCLLLDETECASLKVQLQELIDDFNGFKVIAFPWESLDVPVALTSWGRMERMASFDPRAAAQFVRSNRNRAPEPNAP